MMRIFSGSLAAVSSIALVTAAHANLITNGGFEDTTGFVGNADNTMTLLSGATTVSGWTVTGDALAWIGPTNPFGLSASQGSYFLDFTDYPVGCPCGGVTQSIGTSIGSTYRLTFDLGSSSLFTANASVMANAGAASQVFTNTLTGTNNWESQSFDFTATAATTAITLSGASQTSSTFYIGLDNVSVVFLHGPSGAVPEPAMLVLFGSGILALTGTVRRRKPAKG